VSSFDRAPDRVLVFRMDGSVYDLRKLILVTELYLEEIAIKCLVAEVSSPAIESRHS
jgi:hypothetical protein